VTSPARFPLSWAHGLFAASHQEAIMFIFIMFRRIILYFVN